MCMPPLINLSSVLSLHAMCLRVYSFSHTGGVDGTETVACVAGFTLGAAASLAIARVVVVTTPAGFAWAAAGSAVIDSTFEGEKQLLRLVALSLRPCKEIYYCGGRGGVPPFQETSVCYRITF